jgi:adenylate cyclase
MTLRRRIAWGGALVVPVAALSLLLLQPRLDGEWQHQPAHFWLVLVAALANVALAVATGDAARRRRDGRLVLVSAAFLAGAGFLALHALATPRVLLDSPNAGFVVATPVGLLIASAFAAASALELSERASHRLARRARPLAALVLLAMGAWAAISLAEVGPLRDPLPEEQARGWLLAFAAGGIVLYGFAAARYLRLFLDRGARLPLAVASAYVLLAEAMLAIALARNWHASWWEWHLLMLAAFALVAGSARREWRDERFADLYLATTADAVRDVSVLFADLAGYTSFSERVGERAAATAVAEYLRRMAPVVRAAGGEASQAGDALMASFNVHGDQPDHAERAVRAALDLQREADAVADANPAWPRFRIGVNTGPARTGVVGAPGSREFTPLGDAVNVAARLEGQAEPGQVLVGAETYARLPPGTLAERRGAVRVKGKGEPVEAYVVRSLPPRGDERGHELRSGEEEADDERRAR